jgi:acyl-CoA synthetase (NDP forming)
VTTAANDRPALARLLRPASIAIVGASAEPFSVGANALANLKRFGYPGELHFVSRKGGEIDGKACVASVDDLPMDIDAAILVVPAAVVRETIEACARRRIGGVVVFASGFGEQDEAGKRAQDEFVAVAERHGVAVIGPNCIGFVNYADSAPLTFEPVEYNKLKGPGVCVIAQSGAMSGNIRYALQGRGTPVSHSISTGNEAVVASEDCIDLLIDDPSVSLFAVFVEQIRRPPNFLRLAARARTAGKPIVLLHSGRGARAREAAKTHTGALAGDYAAMRAFVEREGVVLVEGLDELFDVATLLARNAKPTTGGLAVLSNSGALRGVGLDLAEELALPVPDFAPETVAALKAALPSFATVDNPLDITAAAMTKPSMFGDCARAILADPAVGFMLVAAMGGGQPQQMSKWKALKPELEAAKKPVAMCYLGDDYPLNADFMTEVRAGGVPFFRSPERAIRAFARLEKWSHAANAPARKSTFVAPRVAIETKGPLAEWRGKEIFARLGVPIPRGKLAGTAAEARAIAAAIGYPVALKAQADTLAHKSDVGGVIVGVADDAELETAFARLLANVKSHLPNLSLDGVLIEAMAPKGGLEMIVGAKRDPHWGPVLLVGLGGVWTEALHDARLLPAGASADEIGLELRQLKGAALLGGMRGSPRRDVRAIAMLAEKIGALMVANPDIVEIDVNPVNVYAEGEGALALDALIVTQ